MIERTRLPLLAVALAAAPTAAHADSWAAVSDVGRDALVVAALGVPAVGGDWTGVKQAGFSLAATGGTTFALKELIPERRPDGSDRKSFPSGHTSLSFASAATLENRYGWRVGVPAFAVASLVGVARVEARRHYWYDAVAGAAIGTAGGFLFTTPRDSRVHLVPWGDAHGGGAVVAVRF